MVAEVTGFIAVLKLIGIDMGRVIESMFILILVTGFILYLSMKYLWPFLKKCLETFEALQTSVTDLNKTLQEHIVQTDLRLQECADKFNKITHSIEDLKTRVSILEAPK